MGSNKMAKHKNVTTDCLEDKISKLNNILHDIKALGVDISITQRQELRSSTRGWSSLTRPTRCRPGRPGRSGTGRTSLTAWPGKQRENSLSSSIYLPQS